MYGGCVAVGSVGCVCVCCLGSSHEGVGRDGEGLVGVDCFGFKCEKCSMLCCII